VTCAVGRFFTLIPFFTMTDASFQILCLGKTQLFRLCVLTIQLSLKIGWCSVLAVHRVLLFVQSLSHIGVDSNREWIVCV
jgi:hypothetical protein